MSKAPRLKASKLTAHIGYWMRFVSNHVSFAFARKLMASDVTVAEWVVLREMYSNHDTISPSIIAELTGLTRGAISKIISRLFEKQLVYRKVSSTDRRYQEIQLTETAIKLIPKLAILADQNDKEFFSSLTQAERKQLTLLLKKLVDKNQLKKVPIE